MTAWASILKDAQAEFPWADPHIKHVIGRDGRLARDLGLSVYSKSHIAMASMASMVYAYTG